MGFLYTNALADVQSVADNESILNQTNNTSITINSTGTSLNNASVDGQNDDPDPPNPVPVGPTGK
jgi:flagella basal body P-ring formation protein FlgA